MALLKSFFTSKTGEAGVDEAGRGCLAGPVVAAAVILPEDFAHPVLNDSKQLSRKKREQVRNDILSDAADWHVAFVSNTEIDEINIARATYKAMHTALDGLKRLPLAIIIDGDRFIPYRHIPCHTIIKGDALYYSIAAASVLAKTFRDDYMAEIDAEYPQYGWNRNMGYPTKQHRTAITEYGVSPYHRKSFTLLNNQLSLGFI